MSVPCGYFSSNVSTRPLFLLLFCLVLFLAFIQAAFRPLHASDTEEQTELLLSAPILQAVRSHPQILSQNAKLCQSIYRLGLSRAEQRAQISAKLSGGKRLGSNFNSKSSDADRASLRGFKDSENKVFDLDVTLRYALWDWDRGDNRVASYELTYAVNQLELEIALSDQLKSLLFMTLRLNLYDQLLGLHRQILTDITPHIEAVEAQGAAGVIRMADVKIGQAVRISLAAFDVSRYGAVEGVVTRVANNTTQQENMPPFYETLIEIPDLSFPRSPIKPELVPGMQATIDILGGKRTVMDYILTPIKKASRAAFREK